MLDLELSAKRQETINQKLLEEKFTAGLMEFEALLNSINDDSKSKLVDLLEQYTK
jgi:hypothetical protein